MNKKNPLKDILPDPSSVIPSAPNVQVTDNISKVALRRSKVREFMRMGYDAYQIVLILQKGIKVGTDDKISPPVSEWIIKSDMDYIRQEDASTDVDMPGKRAEVLDKLRYLYNQAIREYILSKGSLKNSFLNTALSIIGKISDLEGLKQPNVTENNTNVLVEARITKFSDEVNTLGKEDRNVLITAIRQVLGKRNEGATGNDGVLGEPPTLPAQTSDDEGVFRES